MSVHQLRRFVRDERGEGVISTGIAVLIMALIGAAMWVAFSSVFADTASDTTANIDCLTDNSCTTKLDVGR
jgi:Flp pilus assembly protein TadG